MSAMDPAANVPKIILNPIPPGPVRFSEVLQRELEHVSDSRNKRGVDVPAARDNLIGLSFSGGGIRSATFNLGILQALAEKELLHKFDYLSTVSGGGYIGSWLAALTHRLTATGASYKDVEKTLKPCKYEPNRRSEPSVVHWLRLYSNYLTPHTGVVSGDTWAMLGTWLRNVILNQTILGMMFVSILVLCQSALLPLIAATLHDNDYDLLIAGLAFLFFACISMAIEVTAEEASTAILQNWFQRIKVTATVMVPFVVACVLLNCSLWERTDLGDRRLWQWAAFGAVFHFFVWGIVAGLALLRRLYRRRRGKPRKPMISVLALLLFSPFAGALGGCVFFAYMLLLRNLPSFASTDWLVVVVGSSIVMLIMLLAGTFHIGLVGRGSMDLVREWWARLGGYLALITFGWVLLAGFCVFAPLGMRWALFKLGSWKSVSAGLLWLIHNYLGLKAASSPKTSGKGVNDPNAKKNGAANAKSTFTDLLKSPKILGALAKAAPYVFIVGFVFVISTVVQIGTGLIFDYADTAELWHFNNGLDWTTLAGDYWQVLGRGDAVWLATIGGVFFLTGLGLSWRVDVNEFSLHHFYRNRLVRCYLGASNPHRTPEPFTGFDSGDDLPLCEFADKYPGPYPLINAALNITGGEELGYATRRAKSFVFTPLYCGYELGASGEGKQRFECDDGFLPSYAKTQLGRSESTLSKFGSEGGISLGTAMAISGAAASPNMGYHTAPATAFFMALFDVRLGWWMGNSRNLKEWKSTGPPLGLGYLLSEVFAQSDQQKGYVYLSDGGHFENLSVYELIRRHCRLIVACDADADARYGFGDLLSLIEKARTDFGARIEINYNAIQPGAGGRECEKNWVMGKIYYDPCNNDDVGTLILIKASMPRRTGNHHHAPNERRLPDDVWRYSDQHVTFPHQSTADQWFDELQFESYRALGEYIGRDAAAQIAKEMEAILVPSEPVPTA
jgi:hypothetical protein